MIRSKLFKLSTRNWLRSLLYAFLTATVTGIYDVWDEGHLPSILDIQTATYTGLKAAVGYVLMQLITNSSGKVLKKDNSTHIEFKDRQ